MSVRQQRAPEQRRQRRLDAATNTIIWICEGCSRLGAEATYENETARGAAKRVREHHRAKSLKCKDAKIYITSMSLPAEQRISRPVSGRAEVSPCDYGIVCIASGPYAGRIGYYDDEDEHDKCVVYLGTPCMSPDVVVPLRGLRAATDWEKKHWAEAYMSDGAYKMATRRLRVAAEKRNK